MFMWFVIGFIVLIFLFKFLLSSNISLKDAKVKLNSGAFLVDVRSKEEFDCDHLENTINIPHDEIQKITNIVKDKNKSVLLYCLSGMRAASACSEMRRMGYKDVSNVGSYSRAGRLADSIIN